MITNQDRANIRRIFEKTRNDIAPLVAGKARELNLKSDPQLLNLMVAQNTLRCCMEVVLAECMPYDELFCAELAVRLAAYSISATPIERHEYLTKAVQNAIPNALANKIREGAVIKSTWLTDGIEHPNIPDKGDIQ